MESKVTLLFAYITLCSVFEESDISFQRSSHRDARIATTGITVFLIIEKVVAIFFTVIWFERNMLASHLLKNSLRASLTSKTPLVATVISRAASSHGLVDYELEKIGNREIVGYGFNGDPNYVDRPDFPFPAIRFKSNDVIQALKEKEKGDWKKMTKEEKKALYRASFRQTFSEFIDAPSGEWKSIFGWSLVWVSSALWVFYFVKYFGFGAYPKSFEDSRRSAQLQRLIDIETDIITGLSSHYDYEKETWKK